MSTQLLVSVRSAVEAEAARQGGAGLIDIKEPLRGPLGRADIGVMESVIRAVDGRRPVSAALGELRDETAGAGLPNGLSFVKWGLAACARAPWQQEITARARLLDGQTAVVVAYADAERAASPAVEEVAAFACRAPWPGCVLLLDTFDKSGATLLTWLDLSKIARLCQRCRNSGVRVALAGSLGADAIRDLAVHGPDWIAVRGAACAGSDRRAGICPERVQALVRLLV